MNITVAVMHVTVRLKDLVGRENSRIPDPELYSHMVGESLGDLFVTTASDNANEISGLNPILQNLNDSVVTLYPMSVSRVPCDGKEVLVPVHLREPFPTLLIGEHRKVFVAISFVSFPREQIHFVP